MNMCEQKKLRENCVHDLRNSNFSTVRIFIVCPNNIIFYFRLL